MITSGSSEFNTPCNTWIQTFHHLFPIAWEKDPHPCEGREDGTSAF